MAAFLKSVPDNFLSRWPGPGDCQCGHLSRYFSSSSKGWKPEARAADLVAADCGESGGSLDPVGSLALQIL